MCAPVSAGNGVSGEERSPLVHEGGCQLRHRAHSEKHDAQEGHTKDGSGASCRLLDTGKQGSDDQ